MASTDKQAALEVDLPAENGTESTDKTVNESGTTESSDKTVDMESETPASYASMASQSIFGETQETPRKRPLSPRTLDSTQGPAKKGTSEGNSTSRSGLKRFMGAKRQSGPDRTKLMKAMDGSTFYKCRGLFFQHSQGDMSAVDSRALQSLHINAKEEHEWSALAGMLKQDAYTDLIRVWESLRREKPDLFH